MLFHGTRRELLRGLGSMAVALPMARFAGAAVPPSDKLTVAIIGVGSQGMRVLLDMLRLTEVQVVAVCDVNRGSDGYEDWGGSELRTKVRGVLGDSSWGSQYAGPAAGREVAQDVVNRYYAKEKGRPGYRGCAMYEDYRELLAKEHDVDAVVVSTPDHWHATIGIAAMRAGKHVYSQKPMAHSVWETREMVRVAAETKRATSVSIFNAQAPASAQIREAVGQIGPVHAIDIWTTRASSFWKQGLPTPSVADPVPAFLNWEMWLGLRRCGRTAMCTSRSSGGRGTTLVAVRWATWASTAWIRFTGLWAWACQTGLQRVRARCSRRRSPWPRPYTSSSQRRASGQRWS